jgi:DNA-binding SARP family transcriptional activator
VTPVEFKILGPTRLLVAGRPIELGAAKQRGLLALLLYNVNNPVTIQAIGNHLWPGRPIGAFRKTLYESISRIRTVFTRNHVPAEVLRLPDGYRLVTNAELIDYHRFRSLVEIARAAAAKDDHEAVVAALSEAVDWWTDTPLDELKSADAENTRELMVTMWGRLPALHMLFDAQRALGQHHAILSRLGPLLDMYPHDLELAKHWLLALEATGSHDLQRHYERLSRQFDGHDDELRATFVHVMNRRSEEKPGAEFVPPRQLPRDIREFAGHAGLLAELDAIVDELGAPAGVALTGMPGIGKTTLVTHWAHRRHDQFTDGQLYLNANGYGPERPMTPDDIIAKFLHGLGVPVDRIPAAGDSRRARLAQLLANRKILIVIDNARNADHVRPLLSALSTSLVLITSRDRLKDLTIRDGVRSIAVPTLSPAESESLLRSLIGARRADENPAEVTALAELSAGLPLALRILGQNIAERSEARLADLVDHLREMLSHVPDDETDDEEITLHTFFSWSYGDLLASTARLFRLLGLHPGRSFGVPVANALFGANAQPHLNVLIHRHLLEHDSARRYRLHDLLGRYAARRCELDDSTEERNAALRRMLDFYLLSGTNAAQCLAPQRSPVPGLPEPDGITPLTFTSETEALAWCDAERANLTGATECAYEHGFYRQAWQIPGALHEVYERYGPQSDIVRSNEIALDATRILGELEAEIGTLNNLGATYFVLGSLRDAERYFQQGLDLAEQAGHREGQAVCLHNLGNVHGELGRLDVALNHYHLALQAYRDANKHDGVAFSLHRLGTTYHRLERENEALEYLNRALEIRVHIGHTRGEGATRTALAQVYFDLGELGIARENGHLALIVLRRTMDRSMTCQALITLSKIHYSSKNFDDAVRLAREATEIAAEEIVDPRKRALALDIFSRSLQATGDIDAAHAALAEELAILTDLFSPQAATVAARLATISRVPVPRQASEPKPTPHPPTG